jgi:hypothetical protein
MFNLRRLANVNNQQSLSSRMRRKRFQFFEQLTAHLPRPLTVLDLGGTEKFWVNAGWTGRDDIAITIVNLRTSEPKNTNIRIVEGDATDLSPYGDQSFDIVFSNSLIEHLYTQENQKNMAREICRVAKAYWVQTPNFWFPIEPHFLFPGWQWLPRWLRVAIIRRFRCGWIGPIPDYDKAARNIDEIRLLSRRELVQMFPQARVYKEKFFGLVKSWVMYDGFQGRGGSSTPEGSVAAQPDRRGSEVVPLCWTDWRPC